MPSTPKKPAKPRKRGPSPKTSARAPQAAALAVSGAKTAEIAAELGVSRSQAWRILGTNEVQQYLVMLVNAHSEVLHSLFRQSLKVLEEAMLADRPGIVTKDGSFLEGGADHFARLTAVRQLCQMLTAGRPKPQPPEGGNSGRMTLGQLQAALDTPHENTTDAGSDRAPQLAR